MESQVQIAHYKQNKFIHKDRTFFCSELVAKACKILGILQDCDVSCTKFFPSNFSSKGDSFLKINQGVIINRELQIIIQDDNSETINTTLFNTTGFR